MIIWEFIWWFLLLVKYAVLLVSGSKQLIQFILLNNCESTSCNKQSKSRSLLVKQHLKNLRSTINLLLLWDYETLENIIKEILCRRTVWRFDERRWLKVGESVLVAALSALIFMTLIFAVPDCKPIRDANVTEQHHNLSATTHVAATTVSSLDAGNSTGSGVSITMATASTTASSKHDDTSGQHGSGGHGYLIQVRTVVRTWKRLCLNILPRPSKDSRSP